MKISQILDKIDDNQLFVPAFQREYVWKRDDAKNLISSLIKEYPTGTMLTWETNSPPELKGKHKYNKNQGAVKLVLDGQQRITTLYMIIRGNIPPYYTEEEITVDTRNLYVNVETMELSYYKKNLMVNNPLWLNLTDIFQRKTRAKDVVRELEKLEEVSRERDDLIDDNFGSIERILEREFLEQTIPVKASIKESIDIFYIVNASGVNLTEAELALAQISGYWPEARELFKKKLFDLEKEGFVFKLDFLIFALLGCLYQVGSDMRKLHDAENKNKIQQAWNLLDTHTLDYVMNLMRSQAYIDHTKEINSVYALIPIIVYAYNKGKEPLSQDEINRTVKWFYYSQIRNRYISQLPQKLDKDLGIVSRSEQPFDDLLGIIEADRSLTIKSDEFVGVDVRHALWGLMRWYFKSKNAVCFTTGVHIRKNMGKKYDLEWDHIFPYSRLKEIGYGQDNRLKYALAQEITNRAILTQVANRTKSNHMAKQYLTEVKTKFPQALELQCVPEDESLWERENYEEFLIERRKILAAELNKYLSSITLSKEATLEISIEDMIAEGESDELEFKSSLRWSYKEGSINKKLEQVIMKSIAAFSNADGGILLIGVDDDGNVLGLEHDYSSLKGAKDEFELHLRNLINKTFGVTFATNNLKITFPEIDETEFCVIEIKPGKSPMYLEAKDKNGVASEKFYVRSGNSSQEISLSEISSYIDNRFK